MRLWTRTGTPTTSLGHVADALLAELDKGALTADELVRAAGVDV